MNYDGASGISLIMARANIIKGSTVYGKKSIWKEEKRRKK